MGRRNVGQNTAHTKCRSDTSEPKQRLTESAARDAWRRRLAAGASPDRLRFYECEHCDAWHVGTTSPSELRNRRRQRPGREKTRGRW